ncbi:MAG: PCMD domain-containing protein [Prevotellaceae bacterium]|nr:PCMD domain-containing protein [Prevotellaceae bacterium]
MIKKSLFGFWVTVASLTIFTCDKVRELDDCAVISKVEIEVVSPAAVVLGTPVIDSDRISIPLIFGKYLFPIEMEIKIDTEQKIDKILGFQEKNRVLFESIEDLIRIDLIALSGVVTSYILNIQEVPSRDNAEIERFDILSWNPDHFLFASTPRYDLINEVINIVGISTHFPFTVVPNIIVSDGAHIEGYTTGEAFTFPSYNTQLPVKVVAESGKESTWQIKLSQAQIITPTQAPNADIGARLSFPPTSVSAILSGNNTGSELKTITIDADNGTIRLEIKTKDPNSVWEAQLSFPVPQYTQIVGFDQEKLFPIIGMGTQKSFYLVDMLDGYCVEWKVESVEWRNPDAEIESFVVFDYQSEYQLIELGTPLIFPSLTTVEIPVENGFDFPLIIDSYLISISDDSRLIESLPQQLIFWDFNTTFTVKIEAQNKDVKTWTIALLDARSGSNDARVNNYIIKSYSGTSQTENTLVLHPLANIDIHSKTITFRILDWANKLPLTVQGYVDISPGAMLLPFSFGIEHELVFNTLEDVHPFTVLSMDGETFQTWSVVLQNEAPTRSYAKEVTDFISGAPSAGFSFVEKYLEPDKRQITLMVNDRIPNSSMILAPRIVVSQGARLLGIASGAQLSLSFDQPKIFTVQAEDETTEEWSIVLVYAPQIPNSGFELWGKANNSDMNLLPSNGTGWCTSNNSTLSNTSRTTGYNSPYAVQMQTHLQTLNFVIFKVTTITAASAFTGRFTLKTGVNDVYNPITMTSMGIPFNGNPMPIAFAIDYKYLRGTQLVRTEPNWGSLIPSFKNPVNHPGTDAASLRVELFYNPVGAFDYTRNRDNAIAKGEILERNHVPEWRHVWVPIQATPGKEGLLPTHIVVVMTSSHEGDYFIGAPGSTLTADNFSLVYYQPETGAKLLE